MTAPQTDAGRTPHFLACALFADLNDDCTCDAVPEVEREAAELVLEVAAHVLPPTDVSALRDALRKNR